MRPSCFSHWLSFPIVTLSIISLGAFPVSGAEPPPPHSVSRWSSNTTYNPLTAPLYIDEQCSDDFAWGLALFTKDCKQTLEYFLSTDVTSYGTTYFDFHDRITPPGLSFPSHTTPHRYTFGNCIIAIDMVRFFPKPFLPLPLPRAPVGGWPERDFATYIELYAAVKQVISWCTGTAHLAGWVRAGAQGGIGLFVFGKHSGVDFSMPGCNSLPGEANGTNCRGSAAEKIDRGASTLA